MTTLRTAAQQALEAMDAGVPISPGSVLHDRLRASLAQQGKPVAVHQFRKQYCANWYDGHPDHTDGGGPYEERTLYAAPPRRETEQEPVAWASWRSRRRMESVYGK
jgi:hypothetical protein